MRDGTQASHYGRKFLYGKRGALAQPIEIMPERGSIGLIPPEFDDLQGGELELKDELRAEHSPR